MEHRPGCFPPANCALMRGIGLWNTGRAVPPPPGDGIVEHGGRGKLCRRRAARPLSGDMIVEHGVSCDSRPDMLESRLPQEI